MKKGSPIDKIFGMAKRVKSSIPKKRHTHSKKKNPSSGSGRGGTVNKKSGQDYDEFRADLHAKIRRMR